MYDKCKGVDKIMVLRTKETLLALRDSVSDVLDADHAQAFIPSDVRWNIRHSLSWLEAAVKIWDAQTRR